jgi:hypothetical protein
MTEIHCEFCGPTRIAPHDVNCPTQHRTVTEVKAYPNIVLRRQDLTGWMDGIRETAQDLARITTDTNPEMFSPLIEKATEHFTVMGRKGAECFCGYNPHIDHPEAGRGQLFAYVGQHIRNESGI